MEQATFVIPLKITLRSKIEGYVHVVALARFHVSGSLPLERTIEKTTRTTPLTTILATATLEDQ